MKNIILIGMKSCGKTTVGNLLSQKLSIPFVELDNEIEIKHNNIKNEKYAFREIFKKYGKRYFRNLETDTLLEISKTLADKDFVFACGGGTPLAKENQIILKNLGKVIYLKPDKEALYERIIKNGIPAFFPYPENPKRSFEEIIMQREPTYEKIAAITLDCGSKLPEEIAELIIKKLNLSLL